MKRLTLVIALLMIASQSYAVTTSGSLQFVNNKAINAVTGFSDRLEIFVHRLKVTAGIEEEGQVVDTKHTTCTKGVDENGLPLSVTCTETAEDSTLTDTCVYCGTGMTEGISFGLIVIVTDIWEGQCRFYNAGPGNK